MDGECTMLQWSAVEFHNGRLLPFDIVKNIFSNIGQSDCLECMLVCKAWYAAVPQYASLIWETVNFSKSKVDCDRFWMCLGPHVRRVVVTDDVITMLDKLIQLDCCYIESIKFNRIKSVTVAGSPVQDMQRFIEALRRLSSPRELDFHKVNCHISAPEILSACPKLTQLSCTYSKVFRQTEEGFERYDLPRIMTMNSAPALKCPLFPQITSLCLDVRMNEIMSILKHCPNLSGLHLWLQWPGLLNHNINIINLDHVFKLCPQLDQLLCYWPDKEKPSRYHWKHIPANTTSSAAAGQGNDTVIGSNSKKKTTKLRAFSSSVALGHGSREVVRIIRRYQHTLESIDIDNYDLNDVDQLFTPTDSTWNQLANMHTNQLARLMTSNLPWQHKTLSTFLARCPILSDLTLQHLDPQILENQRDLRDAFSVLTSLRSFELTLNSKVLGQRTTEQLCKLLQVISSTAPGLEQLCVSGFHVLKDYLLSVAASNQNLRVLRLGSGDPYRRKNRPTTKKAIEEFAQNLSPHIRHLELTNLKLITRAFFEQLAERVELTTLTLNCCGQADDMGLRQLLTRKAGSLHSLRMDSSHIEHRRDLINHCKTLLHYNVRENKNQLYVSRSLD